MIMKNKWRNSILVVTFLQKMVRQPTQPWTIVHKLKYYKLKYKTKSTSNLKTWLILTTQGSFSRRIGKQIKSKAKLQNYVLQTLVDNWKSGKRRLTIWLLVPVLPPTDLQFFPIGGYVELIQNPRKRYWNSSKHML